MDMIFITLKGLVFFNILKKNLIKSMPGINIKITISSALIFILLLYALMKSTKQKW